MKRQGAFSGVTPFKWAGLVFAVVFAFFLADFLFCQKAAPVRVGADTSGPNTIAFLHAGFRYTCLSLLPLPVIVIVSSCRSRTLIPHNSERRIPQLRKHVVFHHGVHAAAGVQCADCHRSAGTAVPANAGRGLVKNNSMADVYGGDNFTMQSCLACHRGETASSKNFKRAATYCAACHR